MKSIKFLALAALGMASCVKSPETPPLGAPAYDGQANITIAELRSRYASTTEAAPSAIEFDYVLKARVVGNDESGNIYKQLYIEDETGGINVGIDRNSMYTTHRVGQELFLDLHGLAVVSYGGELQIGYVGTSANRIAWEVYTPHVHFNGAPLEANAKPLLTTISALKADQVNTLIRLDKVHFEEGGKATFDTGSPSLNRTLLDASGAKIEVRTSSYASFAKKNLPLGTGSVIGILGRYRGTWQLTLRTERDLIAFDGIDPSNPGTVTPPGPDPGTSTTFFTETFGATKGTSPWPKIAAYTGYDMKAPVVYSDQYATADVRSTNSLDNHAWFPATKDSELAIAGIDTNGKTGLKLSFDVAVNVYQNNGTMDLAKIVVKANGATLSIPSQVISDNTYHTVTLEGIPDAATLTLSIMGKAADNTLGFRVDNIKVATGGTSGGTVTPTPDPAPTGDFVETFGSVKGTSPWPKIAAYTGWDMKSPVVYSDQFGNADVRSTNAFDNHTWFPANKDSELSIAGIDIKGKTNVKVSFDVAVNVYQGVGSMDLANIEVKANGTVLAIPSQVITDSTYHNVTLSGIAAADALTLVITGKTATNTLGFRVDNVKVLHD